MSSSLPDRYATPNRPVAVEPLSPFEPTILGAVRRHRILVAACGLIAMAIALAISLPAKNEYRASSSLVVRPIPSASGFDQSVSQPSRYAADQIAIIHSRPTAERALDLAIQEGVKPPFASREVLLRTKVSGEVEKNNLITVSFRAPQPRLAVVMANALVEAYRDTRQSRSAGNTRQLDASLGAVERQLTDVRGRIDQTNRTTTRDTPPANLSDLLRQQEELQEQARSLRTQRDAVADDQGTGGVAFSSPATEATVIGTGTKRKMAGALALGLVVGAMIAYVRAARRVRFNQRDEPELVFGAPLLCEIPRRADPEASPLPVVADRHSRDAESFRFAATRLDIETSPSRNIVAVVSGSSADGATTVTVNTAVAMAQAGVRVALVDADIERQQASRLLLGDGAPEVVRGLTGDTLQLFRPMGRALESGDFLDLLRATGGRTLIMSLFQELKAQFDVVLVDVPPLLRTPYATTFASCAEGAVPVVNHGDDVSEHEELAARLSSIGTPVVGYVYARSPVRLRDRLTRSSSVNRSSRASQLSFAGARPSPGLK